MGHALARKCRPFKARSCMPQCMTDCNMRSLHSSPAASLPDSAVLSAHSLSVWLNCFGMGTCGCPHFAACFCWQCWQMQYCAPQSSWRSPSPLLTALHQQLSKCSSDAFQQAFAETIVTWLHPCLAEAYETEIFTSVTDGSRTDKPSDGLRSGSLYLRHERVTAQL